MYIFMVEAFAITASFRVPEAHTFQQTLPLPPVTTLTGLVGAAIGLNFEDAMNFKKDKGLGLGVIGSYSDMFKDLWKYLKVKAGQVISDVILREYLIDFRMKLFVGCYDKDILSNVREHFLSPAYVLTAGNSDDLLKIKKVSNIFATEQFSIHKFQNTILPGDYSSFYEPSINLSDTPITESIRAPEVYLLPTAFRFSGKERRVIERRPFTFVGSPVELKQPLQGYEVKGDSFVLL